MALRITKEYPAQPATDPARAKAAQVAGPVSDATTPSTA